MQTRLLPLLAGFVAVAAHGLLPAGAQTETAITAPPLPTRTQVIELRTGWNAVWLEVEPLAGKSDDVFKNTPVDIAARYLRPVSSAKFITNPVDTPWNQPGWGVWYAPARKDAFIRSLHLIEGNAAYLIHATRDFQWSVEGAVKFRRLKWTHNTFNLAGFSPDPQNPPTFGRLFASAGGKVGQSVYRLIEGRWAQLAEPAGVTIRSGEAYWIYSSGLPDFQGPLDVRLPGSDAVDFGTTVPQVSIQYVNASGATAPVRLEMMTAGSTASAGLPLHQVIADLSTLTNSAPAVTATMTLPELDSGFARNLRLQVQREEMTAGSQTALLSLTSGGQRVWIPVRAAKPATP